MKNRILINLVLALLPLYGATQADECVAMQTAETSLHSFVEQATGLVGFKRGDVVLFEPQFDSLWCPDHVEYIAIARRQAEKGGAFVYLTSPNGVQEHFDFYRTDQGYRLIEATFRRVSYGETN